MRLAKLPDFFKDHLNHGIGSSWTTVEKHGQKGQGDNAFIFPARSSENKTKQEQTTKSTRNCKTWFMCPWNWKAEKIYKNWSPRTWTRKGNESKVKQGDCLLTCLSLTGSSSPASALPMRTRTGKAEAQIALAADPGFQLRRHFQEGVQIHGRSMLPDHFFFFCLSSPGVTIIGQRPRFPLLWGPILQMLVGIRAARVDHPGISGHGTGLFLWCHWLTKLGRWSVC